MEETTKELKDLTQAIRSLENTLKQHMVALSKTGPTTAPQRTQSTNSKEKLAAGPELPKVVRPDQVPIFVRIVFLKIGEIDTLKENYSADIFVQARWREPELDGKTQLEDEDIEWEKYWTPELFVDNVFGEAKDTGTWHTLTFEDDGTAWIYEKRRVNGSFSECLELNQFPFDTQDLTITVSTEKGEGEISMEIDEGDISGINVQSFADEQEWKLHDHIESWKKMTTKAFHNAKFKHPALSVACKASRRPGFFLWNILFVMLFICSLAFSTFAVDATLPQNRLQLSFILLLTTVTFKFIVTQSLPKISYLTYLDKYILTCMSILCLICIWHAVVPLVVTAYGAATGVTADSIACGVLAAFFVGFQLCFALTVVIVARRSTKNFSRKEQEERLQAKNAEEEATVEAVEDNTSLVSEEMLQTGGKATTNNKVGPTAVEIR